MAKPRKAAVKITYTPRKGKTKKTASTMAEYTEGFSFSDCATGESDKISINIYNKDLKWLSSWMPKKGDKLSAKIVLENWKGGGKKEYSVGKFCCDDLSFSGPELECMIGGVSVPERQAFRATQRTKTWQDVTIQEMASRICKRYGLPLSYDGENIVIKTMEQTEQTDCEFLKSACEEYGLYIKVSFGKVFIYSVAKYEAKKPAKTYKLSDFQNWTYNSTLTAAYTGATISYTAGESNEERKAQVGEGPRLLSVNEKVDNLADAQRKAKAKVNEENRKVTVMSVTLMGDPSVVSGQCIAIKDAYNLDGKYFVDSVTHDISSGGAYTMDLQIHRVQKQI